MASHTDLVMRISEAGAIPADRPIDHLRRISATLFGGVVVGSLVGSAIFIADLTVPDLFIILLLIFAAIAFLMFSWRFMKEPVEGEPVPVVARTLATDESPYLRTVERGPNPGLLVPVVAQPVDGSPSFRSVILIRQTTKNDVVEDPAVGTLLPLIQIEPGKGELENIDEVTPEQTELMENLRKHPRRLSNNAPALPMRRGPLEKTPGWAAAQWWGSAIIGAFVSFVLAWFLAQ